MSENTEEESREQRSYANYLRVAFNYSEFLLDFAQLYERSVESVHTQLVASPPHMKQFVDLMQRCVSDYEKKYGRIDIPQEH